jgi:hypothetical protein
MNLLTKIKNNKIDISEIKMLTETNELTFRELQNAGLSSFILDRINNYKRIYYPAWNHELVNTGFTNEKNNLIIVGPFGSGKTALLSNLLGYLNINGRVVFRSGSNYLHDLNYCYSQGILPISNHHIPLYNFGLELRDKPGISYRISIFEIESGEGDLYSNFNSRLISHLNNKSTVLLTFPVDSKEIRIDMYNSFFRLLDQIEVQSLILLKSKIDLKEDNQSNEKLFDELCSKIDNNRIVSNYDFDIMEYTVGPILFNGIYKEKHPLNEANNIKLLDKIVPNFCEHKSTFFERLFYR